jgi:Holliday junction resolvasome RuvABC ATP-dependent DNA helicase subunit
MHLVNQNRIKLELDRYFRAYKDRFETKQDLFSLIVFGRSGYGKTTFVKLFAKKYFKENFVYFPTGDIAYPKLGQLVIIDEAHLIQNFEMFYNALDSKKFGLVFCTNSLGKFPEAFLNRNYLVVFDKYKDEHIAEIIRKYFPLISKEMSISMAHKFLLNPRITHNSCSRIIIFRGNNKIEDSEMSELLSILGFKEFEPLTQLYVDFLRKVRKASLSRIAASTGIAQEYIEDFIEPFLIEEGIIEVGSFGRRIVE